MDRRRTLTLPALGLVLAVISGGIVLIGLGLRIVIIEML